MGRLINGGGTKLVRPISRDVVWKCITSVREGGRH